MLVIDFKNRIEKAFINQFDIIKKPTPQPEKDEARNRRSEAEADKTSVAEGEGGKESRATERGMGCVGVGRGG